MQGDVLSGAMAVFKSWAAANPSAVDEAAASVGVSSNVLAAWAACAVARLAAQAAYQGKRRSMVAGDVIAALGAALDSMEGGYAYDDFRVFREYVRMEHGTRSGT